LSRSTTATASDNDSDLSPEERRNSTWLDKNRAVHKRLSRLERNLKRQFDQQRANDQAEWQRERREMREELDRLNASQAKNQATADDAQHEREMAELEAAQAAAYEAGDTAKASRIGREMAEKVGLFMQAKTEAKLGQQRKAQQREGDEGERGGRQRQGGGRTKAQQFVAANAAWWDDNLAARGYANELFAEASKRGEDLESDELFERIAKKLKKQFPKLKLHGLHEDEDDEDDDLDEFEDDDLDDEDDDDADDEDEDEPRAKRRPAALQSFRRRSPQGKRRGRTRITAEDEAAMRDVGLDPANDKHVLSWVNEGEAIGSEG
jgi:hypothetical protein